MSDYADLSSEKRAIEGQISDTENANRALQEKIDRLKSAKNAIKSEKDTFFTIKYSTMNIIFGNYDWKGEKFNSFSTNGSDLEKENDNYYTAIDDTLDAINNKITELENEMYENDGILGYCRARWNDLSNAIENFFN